MVKIDHDDYNETLRRFREEEKLVANIAIMPSGKYVFDIMKWVGGAKGWERVHLGLTGYISYEQAQSNCILKLLELSV